MKIVVIGGTGLIGSKLVTKLREHGHEAVAASPNTGVNTLTGEGLDEVLTDAAVVIDVSNSPSFERAAVMEFFETSTRNLLAGGRTMAAWKNLITDDALYQAIVISLLLAVFTVVLMLLILVPTMIWVRLRAPWAKGVVEFLCLLPLTIPALVIVVGLRNVYLWVTYFLGESALTLTFVYVVLVLPFAYRAIDAALSAIDLKTLSEAARSLGAGWLTTIARVVVPNIWSGILSAAFISIAVVLGEYTIASLSGYETLQVQIVLIGHSGAEAVWG